MLQYPVQLPPLSLSPPSLRKGRNYHDSNKRFQKDPFPRSAFAGFHSPPALQLAPSPVLSSFSSSSSSSSSSPSPLSPSASFFPPPPAKQPANLVALVHPTPSDSANRSSSSSSSRIEDVLTPGDFVGEGCLLQGESIRLVSFGSSPPTTSLEPATEFRVKRVLGHGSYAIVYLVQEVLSRPQLSEDGHLSTIGLMEFDNKSFNPPEIQYGREYAIKCLSKANLDEDELAAQMSEVSLSSLPLFYSSLSTNPRSPSISLFVHIPTS